MTDALVVSNVLLWIVVCVLGLVVVALTRQIGLLHERIAPVGALAVERGPAVGEVVNDLVLESLDGQSVRIGAAYADATDNATDNADTDAKQSSEDSKKTLLFFLSPTCPVCATLLPTLQRMVQAQSEETRLIYASDGPRAQHEAFSKDKGLAASDYILSRELGMHFEVSKLPYAVLIDASGTIRAKGLVNTREHVESLFEAERMGVASLQQYLMNEPAPNGASTPDKGAA